MSISRRDLLHSAVAAGAVASVGQESILAGAEKVAVNGRIKHSVVFWCFNVAGELWDIEKTCQIAKSLGIQSVEICGPETWPVLKKHGLTCAIAPNGMPGAPFMKGFNNPRYHDEVIATTSKMIDDCAAAGVPNVIAFTGYKWNDADDPKSGEISSAAGTAMVSFKIFRDLGEFAWTQFAVFVQVELHRMFDHASGIRWGWTCVLVSSWSPRPALAAPVWQTLLWTTTGSSGTADVGAGSSLTLTTRGASLRSKFAFRQFAVVIFIQRQQRGGGIFQFISGNHVIMIRIEDFNHGHWWSIPTRPSRPSALAASPGATGGLCERGDDSGCKDNSHRPGKAFHFEFSQV